MKIFVTLKDYIAIDFEEMMMISTARKAEAVDDGYVVGRGCTGSNASRA